MKLALLYTTWTGDDMEMLKRSIEQHLPHVDFVQIWFQCVSNKDEYSRWFKLYDMAKSLGDRVETCHWEPNLDLSTKENERIKHNEMIQDAKKQGFTHFIMAAGDHFYEPEQLEYAKKFHKNNPDIDVSFTEMITYYKKNDLAMWPLEEYYMPFIHVMKSETEISKSANYQFKVDPSVKVNTCEKMVVFNRKNVILHHYSMVRPDIKKKFRNAAASIRWSKEQVNRFISEYKNAKPGDKIEYFQNREIKEISEVLKLL